MLYFRARHLATMTGPLIEDGCVAVDGDRIVAVGTRREIDPPRIDHDIDGLLMPGLINSHTHLELTNVPRPETPGTFQQWLLTTMGSTREADVEIFNGKRGDAVRQGIAQCLKFGVTAVRDISQNVAIVRPILAGGPMRSISYGECLGLGERRGRFDQLLLRATDLCAAGSFLRIGVSPHAPYTVDAAGYSAAVGTNLPWTTHLSETLDEAAFVHGRGGAFRSLYAALGFDPGPPDAAPVDDEHRTVIAWLARLLGDQPFGVLAHVNYCTDGDLQLLADHNADVAYCPRTHAYFGHPPHRWREMLRRGINVCVGTDSCASSPDLNLVDDLRLMHRDAPEIPPQTLWECVTFNAAMHGETDAAGVAWRNGILHASRADQCVVADMIAWPTRSDDPLSEVLEVSGMLSSAIWIGGEPLIPSPGTPGEG